MGEYDNRLGTLFLGIFFNTFLFGVVSVQYVTFFGREFRDRWYTRAGVLFLCVNDTFMWASMLYLIWFYSVQHFDAPEVLLSTIPWPFALIPICTAVTAAFSHVSMAHRLYCMSKSTSLLALLLLGTTGVLGSGIVFGICALTASEASLRGMLRIAAACWLGLQVSVDILIAVLLIIFLHRHKTSSQETNTVINRLVRVSVQTGAFPMLLAISGLISFLVCPQSNLYLMFVVPIGRAYTTTMMDGLNVRQSLKAKLLKAQELDASRLAWMRPTTAMSIKSLEMDASADPEQNSDSTLPKTSSGAGSASLEQMLATPATQRPEGAVATPTSIKFTTPPRGATAHPWQSW